MVLRLEDLDGERSAPHYVDATLRDLEWLGIDWDGPPRLQSAGVERIRAAALKLAELGLAYPCVCRRGDLRAAVEAPQEGTTELSYPGRCRDRFIDAASAKAETGIAPALRFRVAEGLVEFEDRFVGYRTYDVAKDCGDFVVLRRDGVPSYQLSVVIDDDHDGVTEVVRGDDLLPSTARQKLLQTAFGLPTPAWYHVPLVVDANGRRFAKRSDALSLERLRATGVDPRAIVGWAARESGFPEIEGATASELIHAFDWAGVPRTRVVFEDTTLATLAP